jgi:dTDP-4-dehydrorhamnose reductase
MKKLIVTGAKGFVAGNVVAQAGDEWEVHAFARESVPFEKKNLVWHGIDLLDAGRLRDLFSEIKPDAVIHAAAIADIDFCEKNKESASAVNVGVTKEIVQLCSRSGARLVHCSTDTVFDGIKGFYTESDPPKPVNYYGETKVQAEKVVLEGYPSAAIPRLALVMGLPAMGGGNSFLSRMLSALDQGKEVGVPDEEIRSPMDVISLARALLELAGNDYSGFIHLACNDTMNRFVMSQRIVELMGYPVELVVVKNAGNIPGRAPRPRDVSLDNSKARSVLKTPMLSLDDSVRLVLESRKGN